MTRRPWWAWALIVLGVVLVAFGAWAMLHAQLASDRERERDDARITQNEEEIAGLNEELAQAHAERAALEAQIDVLLAQLAGLGARPNVPPGEDASSPTSASPAAPPVTARPPPATMAPTSRPATEPDCTLEVLERCI